MSRIHPALTMPFDLLCAELERATEAGLVRRVDHKGASLYCYTQQCVYKKAWSKITRLARGLIIDHDMREIIALPFEKFFNIGEEIDTVPNLSFETFEKLDGSLIIIYWHNRRWNAATKGSLTSPQAQWAQGQLDRMTNAQYNFRPGNTWLCEAIYPTNKIVINYDYEGLVLLGGYGRDGYEFSYNALRMVANQTGWRIANRWIAQGLSWLIEHTKTLPSSKEGFVLRFADGTRLKLKGDAYCRIHRMINGCTPLALWEAMMCGENLANMRRELPEEFWPDFDKITMTLGLRIATFVHQVTTAADSVEDLTDKELGQTIKSRFNGQWAKFVFQERKTRKRDEPFLPSCKPGEPVPMIRRAIFNVFRPTANKLDGYEPSESINRVLDEAA